ncbi:MAG: Uma2 family endonuclease [Treponema sp.]|jgi:Uma2 family endonuclease|nr:Uma2 family endonuclease [Treponema sp.]
MALPKEIEYYTYANFLEWDESVRAEIVDGEFVMMSPPLRSHQRASMELSYQIRDYLEGKPCKVYAAPFAVRLSPKEDHSDDTVLEPDIVVVCDSAKLDDRGCNGPPDFVVEIVSPSTAKYDRITKFRKYQIAGVREYWIVDSDAKTVQVCILENGRYVMSMYDETETAPIAVLPGCEIDLAAVFAE